MSKPQTTLKNQATHSQLLRFRKRANCQNCKLKDACRVYELMELHCILALIADSLHTLRLNAIRGNRQ